MTDVETSPEHALTQFRPAAGLAPFAIGGAPLPTPAEFDMITGMAAWYHRARVYKQYESPEAIFLGLMTCRDLGVAPTLGLSRGFVIKGRFDLEARVKLAAIEGRVPGFRWEFLNAAGEVVDGPIVDRTKAPIDGYCRIRAWINDKSKAKIGEFSMERARSAGLVKADSAWSSYQEDMLTSRALTRVLPLVAGPAMYGMMPAVLQGDPVEAEYEVVSDRPREPALAPAADGAQGAAPSPAPAIVDYRQAFSSFARKMGKTRNAQLLDLLGLVFKELGLTAPQTYSAIGPSDWKRAYDALAERYDPETGQQRPKAQEKEATATEPKSAGMTAAGVASESVIEAEVEAEIPTFDEPELSLMVAYDPWPDAEQGNGAALVAYAEQVAAAFKKAGRPRTFIKNVAGDVFYTYGPALVDCGSTKTVDGKRAPLSVLIATTDEVHVQHVASEALRIMLAAATKQAFDTLEAGGGR